MTKKEEEVSDATVQKEGKNSLKGWFSNQNDVQIIHKTNLGFLQIDFPRWLLILGEKCKIFPLEIIIKKNNTEF